MSELSLLSHQREAFAVGKCSGTMTNSPDADSNSSTFSSLVLGPNLRFPICDLGMIMKGGYECWVAFSISIFILSLASCYYHKQLGAGGEYE